MKTIVIYDSAFGNTRKIAEAIYKGLEGEVWLKLIEEVDPEKIQTYDLVIVGSPTQGGRPTAGTMELLNKIREGQLKGVLVAAFDTRLSPGEQNILLRLLMRVIGYAADKIAKILVNKGGKLIEEPQGFIVNDKEGPLRVAEIERAQLWGSGLQKVGV